MLNMIDTRFIPTLMTQVYMAVKTTVTNADITAHLKHYINASIYQRVTTFVQAQVELIVKITIKGVTASV